MLICTQGRIPCSCFWTGTPAFSYIWIQTEAMVLPGYWAYQPSELTYAIRSPGFPTAHSPCRPSTCHPLQSSEPISYNKSLHTYTFIYRNINIISNINLIYIYAAAAKLLQSCPTLCDPIDGSPLGSPIPGILQARTLEWVAISFSNAWKWKMKVRLLSCIWLLVTPWTAAYQARPSIGFSRQEYWSGVPLPSHTHTHTHIWTSQVAQW